ncbi:hypothetical protein SUDANB15_00556 [Streptomyces sp. enrichment culture]
MTDRHGDAVPVTAVRTLLDRGAADRVVPADASREVVGNALTGGWARVNVTHGRAARQEAGTRRTGLHRLVQGRVVSEEAGCEKPGPGVLHAAAASVEAFGQDPEGEPGRVVAELCARAAAYCGSVAIWIRLPQVSSKTAVVTGPVSRGSWTKRTPRPRRRSYSARTSSTANWASGMPSWTSASR